MQQIFSTINNVLQQNGITPPSQQGMGPPQFGQSGGAGFGSGSFSGPNLSSLGLTNQSGTQGSSASDFLSQNGVSPGQFQNALFASAQQSGGMGIDLSQLFQNASSGQSVNLSA
jgi:hypothetical protein